MNKAIRKALSLKGFILQTILLASAFSLAQGALVRPYNPETDYKAVHNLCLQHWKAFDENPTCTGLFDFMLKVLLPNHPYHNHSSMRGIKARVLQDKKIIGIQLSVYPITATKELMQVGIFEDDSYAELSYIGIDKNHQGKGYGSQLFNSCKEELLENKNLKAILARVNYSNVAAMDWHRKQGFIELTLGNTKTFFEKSCLREAAGYGQKVFKLELDQEAELVSTYTELDHPKLAETFEEKPELTDEQKVLVSLVTQKAIEDPLLTNEQIHYAIEAYIQTSFNREKAHHDFIVPALTKRIAPAKLKKTLNALFDYVDEVLAQHSAVVDSIRTAKTTI